MCWSCFILLCQVDLLGRNDKMNKYVQHPTIILHVDALFIQHVMRTLAPLQWNTITSGTLFDLIYIT